MSSEEADAQIPLIKMYGWRTLIMVVGVVGALISLVNIVQPSLGWSEFTSLPYWWGLVLASGVFFTFFCWRMDSRPVEESDEEYEFPTYIETKRWFYLFLLTAVAVPVISGLSSTPNFNEAALIFTMSVYASDLCWAFDKWY